MGALRKYSVLALILAVFVLQQGCFKEIAETREPVPDIIWPKPPDIPRIRLVNTISGPEDFGIRETTMEKIVKFFKGEKRKPIVNPYGIAIDAEGRLFVVDSGAQTVHVFDEQKRKHYTFPENQTTLTSPIDIAIDAKGNIYISDSSEGVVKIFREGGSTFVGEIGKGLLKRPTGLTINWKTGELLVVDTKNADIVRYDLATMKVRGIWGKDGKNEGLFHYPTNIFVCMLGQIYVTDSLNFRVQVLDHEGNFIRTFGKAGDTPGYFSRPKGVAVDSDGNIYVVDALFDNVQIFNQQGQLLMDFGGPGSDYGRFWLPSGIFIDEKDRVYIADTYNHRVQVFQYMKGDEFLRP